MALEAPLVPENILQQGFASAAGLPVGSVVCTHDSFNPCLFDTFLKGRKVGFIHVLPGNYGVEAVAFSLGAAVHCKVLGAGSRLQVFIIISLKSFHKSHSQLSCQVRIFPVGFMPAAPSGVPEYIHIGSPKGQPLVNIRVVILQRFMVFCPAFG